MRILGGGGSQTPLQQLVAQASTATATGLVSVLDATTLNKTNGAAVLPWTDPQGNAFTLLGSSSPTFAPTGFTPLGGSAGPAVTFTAGGGAMECDALATLGSSGGAFTAAFYYRATAVNAAQILAGLSTGSTSPIRYIGLDGTVSNSPSMSMGGNTATPASTVPQATQGTYSTAYANVFSTENTLLVLQVSGATSAAWVNGQYVPLALSGDAAQAYTKFTLGGLNYNSALHPSSMAANVRWIRTWNRPINKAGHAALVYSLGLQAEMRCWCVALGDSITAGVGADYNWYSLQPFGTKDVQPVPLSGAVNIGPHPSAVAVAGRTLVNNAQVPGNNVAQSVLSTIQAGYVPGLPCLVFVFGGHNDVYYGAGTITGAQVAASLATVIAMIKAAAPGAYVVACTPIQGGNSSQNWASAPNYGGSTAPYQQALSDYAAAIRTGYATLGADAIVDFWNCPGITYQSDATHPDDAGQTVMGAFVPWATLRAGAVNKALSLQFVAQQ